jgi:acyl-coenzyme A thioesterase PaaI-like protein
VRAVFIAPASGNLFRFVGKVIKPGKTLFHVQAEAFALNDQNEKTLVATMSATMFRAVGRDKIKLVAEG